VRHGPGCPIRRLSRRVARINDDGLLAEFGKRRAGARRKYQQFIEEGMSAESIWKDLKGQIYLGDDDFVEQMRGKLGERDEDVNIPRVQQRGSAPKLSAICRQHRNRDEGIRAAYETGAYSYQQIAKEFGVHFTTVGRIVRQPRVSFNQESVVGTTRRSDC
jgi:putative transposase